MKLTQEQLLQNAEAMIAFANGRPIEYIIRSKPEKEQTWCDWDSLEMELNAFRYRPKPAPKTRPWNCPDDVPGPVCWIRPCGEPHNVYLIVDVGGPELRYGQEYQTPYPIDGKFEHSTDRKTWLPCVVTIKE